MTSVRSGYVMNDALALSYLEWGDSGAPAVLFIAPIRSPAYIWRDIAERLADRYRVIGINLRGHGDSGPFPARRYDPDGYVDDIAAFVEQLGLGRVTIAAFSAVAAGAAVGFAAAHPESTRALVLMEGGVGKADVAEEAGKRVRSMPSDFPDWQAALDYYGSMPDQVFTTAETIAEQAPYVFRRLPDGRVTWKHDPLLREQWPGDDPARNTGEQGEQVWEAVRCPILVVKGASDVLSVEACEWIVRYGTGSRWVTVPDVATHFINDENPAGLVSTIEPFLAEVHRDREPDGARPLAPTSVSSGYVMNGDVPLHYHEWGSPDAPCILFLGPLRTAAYYWQPIAEQLSDRYHCVAVNLRAHGDSGPMLSAHTDCDLYVSDVAAVVDQLGLGSPSVVAFAPIMAGAGVAFAAAHPGKLDRLILIDGGTGLSSDLLPHVRKRQADTPRDFDTWDAALAAITEAMPPSVQPLAGARAPYLLRELPGGRVTWKYDPVVRDEYLGSDPPPYIGAQPAAVWERVRCPILFVAPQGGSLQLSIEDCKELVGYGNDSRFAEIPDAGHYIHEDNPAAFLQVLETFLDETRATARTTAL